MQIKGKLSTKKFAGFIAPHRNSFSIFRVYWKLENFLFSFSIGKHENFIFSFSVWKHENFLFSSRCSADVRIIKEKISYEILLTQKRFSYYHSASARLAGGNKFIELKECLSKR